MNFSWWVEKMHKLAELCRVVKWQRGAGGLAKLCAKSAAQPWWLLLKEEEFENKFCKQKVCQPLILILVESLKCKIVAVS